MSMRVPTRWIFCLGLFVLLVVSATLVQGQDAVDFSGVVKKVKVDKSKVSIKNPETKKRFTVIIDDKTILTGYGGVADVKKGDKVAGKYIVTSDGKYIATELMPQ
jgi:hypothetical protein